jgi:ABC-2 type transport system permease protein
VLGRTCRAEWTRLWTVAATWWSAAAAAVAMLGIGTVAGLDAGAAADGDPAWSVAEIATMPAQFALLALALLAASSDHVTGGIVPTLQWTPRRGVLLVARTAVAVGTGTLLALLLAVGCAVAARTVARPELELPLAEGLDVLGTVALVVAAGSTLAVGLGLLLRSTAGGLVSIFLLMLVLPLLLPQFGYAWLTSLAHVLPGSGAAHLLLGGLPGMTTASSVTVLLCWAVGGIAVGGLRLLRDDANR